MMQQLSMPETKETWEWGHIRDERDEFWHPYPIGVDTSWVIGWYEDWGTGYWQAFGPLAEDGSQRASSFTYLDRAVKWVASWHDEIVGEHRLFRAMSGQPSRLMACADCGRTEWLRALVEGRILCGRCLDRVRREQREQEE